jgi:tetratricopeptide (TPR) repeat protein
MAQRQLNAPDAAKEDWKLAFEQKIGDVKSCCFLALAQLHSGDADGYRRVCAQMVDELGTTPDEDARFRFAWACAHGSSALNDLQIPLELAAKLVEENPDCAAYQCTLGALLYRAGRFEEAVRPLSQSAVAFAINPSDQFSTLYPKLLMAMVHWELGEVKKSQELFDEVQSQYDDAINSASSWNRRATLQLLRDEAEALVSSDRARPQGNLLAETARDPSNHAPSVEHATQNKPD